MTKKISKEVRKRIHELHGQSSSVKDILSIFKLEQVTTLGKSICRVLKGNDEDNVKNKAFASITEDVFNINRERRHEKRR